MRARIMVIEFGSADRLQYPLAILLVSRFWEVKFHCYEAQGSIKILRPLIDEYGGIWKI